MLASITPLGERSRRQRWGVTTSFLAAASALAGLVGGGLLGAAGGLLPLGGPPRTALLAGIVAAGLLLDLGVGGLRLPTHLRQVDERWLSSYRGYVYGAGFGAQLGVGLATVITTSTVYAVLAAELLAPSAARGATIGAVFGAVRGLSVLLGARLDSPARLAAFHRRFAALDRPARLATLAAQALVLLVAVGAAA